MTFIREFLLSLHPSDLRAWGLVLSATNIASITLRVNDVEGSVIELNSDITEINSSVTTINSEVVEINGNLSGLSADFENLTVRYNVTATEMETQKANIKALVAGTGVFSGLIVYHAEFSSLLAKYIDVSFLEGKNIYCSGCFGGSLGFDAANFDSCTVSGNINVGSINWKGVDFITLDVLTAGGGHTKRTFFIQG